MEAAARTKTEKNAPILVENQSFAYSYDPTHKLLLVRDFLAKNNSLTP